MYAYVVLCSYVDAVYRLPRFPEHVQAVLSASDPKLFSPGSKCKRLLIDALYADLRKRDIL